MKFTKKEVKALNKVYKDIESTTIVDPKILNAIDKEKSVLGKEILLCHQLHTVYNDLPKKEAKSQMVLYFIRLFMYNNQILESVSKELADDNKLLKKRVNKEFKENAVHKEIHKKLVSIADKHLKLSKHHFKKFDHKKTDTRHHIMRADHHRTRAEDIYDNLLHKDAKKMIKTLVLKKLVKIYEKIVLSCDETAMKISDAIKLLDGKGSIKGKVKKLLYDIHKAIELQGGYLRHFAVNYSKSMVHSAEYIDDLKNKIILYHHKK
jgi:hypothetical protein